MESYLDPEIAVRLLNQDSDMIDAGGALPIGVESTTQNITHWTSTHSVMIMGTTIFIHQKESLFNVQWWYVTRLKIQSKKIVLMAALILLVCLVLSL